MSQTYNIVCTQCRQHLWVGQRDYIYSTPEHMSNLASFLHAHLNHPLMFVNEESSELDESEEQFADDEDKPQAGTPKVLTVAEADQLIRNTLTGTKGLL